MKSNTKIYRTAIAYFMLLLVSLTILPFNLFHHHTAGNKVCSTISSCSVNFTSAKKTDFILTKIEETNPLITCLFCAWQVAGNARLTYVVSHIGLVLPEFSSFSFRNFFLSGTGFQAILNLPNKSPPTFLFT